MHLKSKARSLAGTKGGRSNDTDMHVVSSKRSRDLRSGLPGIYIYVDVHSWYLRVATKQRDPDEMGDFAAKVLAEKFRSLVDTYSFGT
jgi:hypothetical protein